MIPGMVDPRRRYEMERWANDEDSFLPEQEGIGPPPEMPPPARQPLSPPGPPPEYNALPQGPALPPRGGIATPPFLPERPSFPMPPQAQAPQSQGAQPPGESPEFTRARERLNILLQNPPQPHKPSLLGRIGSMAMGAGAGYLASRRVPFDEQGVHQAQAALLNPGSRDQQNWQQNVNAAQAQVAMGRQQQLDQSKIQYDAAHADEARGRAKYMNERGAVETSKFMIPVTQTMVDKLGYPPETVGTMINYRQYQQDMKNAGFELKNESDERRTEMTIGGKQALAETQGKTAQGVAETRSKAGFDAAKYRADKALEAAGVRAGATTGAARIGAEQRNQQTVQDAEGNFVVVDKASGAAKKTGVKGAPKASGGSSTQQLIDAMRTRGKGATPGAEAPAQQAAPSVKAGDRVKLKSGKVVTITSVDPKTGKFEYKE